ncbi:MAG: hypothetical protein WCL59_02590, partial [Cyanobium sp. ELA507]
TYAFVAGITDVDLKASNLTANGQGTYSTTATSVTGDASADSTVMVAGLLGSGNSATLYNPGGSSNLSASAILTNTVLASTTTGAASAIAHGDAAGISGYNVNFLTSGTITASAVSNTSAIASTVTV